MKNFDKFQLPLGNDLPLSVYLYRYDVSDIKSVPVVELSQLTIYYGQHTLECAVETNFTIPYTFEDNRIRLQLTSKQLQHLGFWSIWLVGVWQGRNVSVNYTNWIEVVPQSIDTYTFEHSMGEDVILPNAVFLPAGLTQDEIDVLARQWEAKIRNSASVDYVDSQIKEVSAKFSKDIAITQTAVSSISNTLSSVKSVVDDLNPLIKDVTEDELKVLIANKQLIPGCKYRFRPKQKETATTVGFDSEMIYVESSLKVVLEAISVDTLSTSGDIYYPSYTQYNKWFCEFLTMNIYDAALYDSSCLGLISKVWDTTGTIFSYNIFDYALRKAGVTFKKIVYCLRVNHNYFSNAQFLGTIQSPIFVGFEGAYNYKFAGRIINTKISSYHSGNPCVLLVSSGTIFNNCNLHISGSDYLKCYGNIFTDFTTMYNCSSLHGGIGGLFRGHYDSCIFLGKFKATKSPLGIATVYNTVYVSTHTDETVVEDIPESSFYSKVLLSNIVISLLPENISYRLTDDIVSVDPDKGLLKVYHNGKYYALQGLTEYTEESTQSNQSTQEISE